MALSGNMNGKLATLAGLVSFLTVPGLTAQQDDSPMTKEMKASSLALKELRKIPRGDWEAMAKAVRDAQQALLKSMSFVPTLVQEMPEGPEKAKAAATARQVLGSCYVALSELELAYLAKDQDKVNAAMEKVKEIKKEGHQSFADD